MGPVDNPRILPQLFLYSTFDGRKMRTGIPDRISVLHAGGKYDCLCSPVNHHLGPGYSFLAGAAAAGEKTDYLNRASLFKR